MRSDQRLWTDIERDLLLSLIKRGVDRELICQRLGRTRKSVREQYRKIRTGEIPFDEERGFTKAKQRFRIVPETQQTRQPTPHEVLDRDRRAGLAPASLTAALFGDPLPGYSALDRRQQK